MSTTMDMEEQQPPAKKSRMDDPSSKEESNEIVVQNDSAIQRKKPVQEDNADNYANNFNAPTEELDKVKEENEALREKLKESERKAEMIKNELEEIIQTKSQKLEQLANEIVLLKEQQRKEEETTSSLDQMEMELPPCFRLLPLETWTDIFSFLPRLQLAELVPQIGDWHFASKAQCYLHECGKITLGEMYIRKSTAWINRKNGPPIVKLCNDEDYEHQYFGWDFSMADVPIPKNIINFAGIFISYFNEYVLGFLQEFHRNSLLTNVDLCLHNTNVDSDAFSQLVPLLNSIETLNLFYIDIEAFIQKEFSTAMLESTRILFINYKLDDAWYSRWLRTPREDGKPRVLFLDGYLERSIFAFIEHIKKDFMDSCEAASFFIHLLNLPNAKSVQSDALENNKTSERLVINANDQTFGHVTIARHPMQATDEEWIKEMGKELDSEYGYRYINFEI